MSREGSGLAISPQTPSAHIGLLASLLCLLSRFLKGLGSFLLPGWPLPCLVVVEATPALAAKPASRHHLAQQRGGGEARLFEPFEEHIGNVQRGIEPNKVKWA